jgi:hypothetical protein
VGEARITQILERTVSYYEAVLWEEAPGVRSRLSSAGVEEETLRRFQVGWAPGRGGALLELLGNLGADREAIVEAGIARSTERGPIRVHFHNRVMFPVRDREGNAIGFAAMATSPGPSWPEWITSPEGALYSRGAALFGIDTAAEAIARVGHALVVTDCLELLRLRQAGEEETVAVTRSAVKPAHLALIAAELGVEPDALEVGAASREELDGAVVVCPATERVHRRHLFGERRRASPTASRIVPDRERRLTRPERALMTVIPFVLGAGIPLGWVAITRPDPNSPSGPGTAFVIAAGGVVATYILLTFAAAVVAGWMRTRSRSRRMRGPWERGATEWQPTAWTYHRFEEVLIGAALLSAVVLLILFVTTGGFGG